MSAPSEIKSLTGLRWLAALLVFTWHGRGAMTSTPGQFPAIVYDVGWSGVTIFFALSGFLLTRLYFDRFAKRIAWSELRPYLLKRFIRIYPVYFFLLAAALANRELNPRYEGRPGPSLGNLVSHIFMVHGYFAGYRDSAILIPSAWTLTIEESFYLLLPVLCLALATVSRRSDGGFRTPAFTLTLVGIVAASLALGSAFDASFPDPRWFAPNWENTTIFGQMPTFALGIGAAVLVLRNPDHPLLRSRLASNALGVLSVVVFLAGAWHFRGQVTWMERFTGQAFFGSSAVLMLLALCGPSIFARVLALPIFVYAGRISYVLYLLEIHSAFRELVTVVGLTHPLPVYFLCSAVAAAIYEVVEKPIHRWLRHRWSLER